MPTFKDLMHRLTWPMAFTLFKPRDLHRETRVYSEAIMRGLAQNAYLGNNTALCRVLGRYKMYVDTRDILISSHLLLEGYWEMWVTEVITSLVKPGMVVADIGANLGYFTILMSDLVGADGVVHAFEPNPEMVCRLNDSLIVNGFSGRTQVHQLLLGRADGEQMAFHLVDHMPGGAHMAPVTEHDLHSGRTILPTYRLDSRPDWQRIEFAKIDVEGAEEAVWEGAEQLLREDGALKVILMEFVRARYTDAGSFLDRMMSFGFGLEIVDPAEGIQPISRERLVDGSTDDEIMLLLRR